MQTFKSLLFDIKMLKKVKIFLYIQIRTSKSLLFDAKYLKKVKIFYFFRYYRNTWTYIVYSKIYNSYKNTKRLSTKSRMSLETRNYVNKLS